jgi:amino acid permease
MTNKFKINFESNITIYVLYVLVLGLGLGCFGLLASQLLQTYTKNNESIYSLLDLKNRVSIEKVDLQKIDLTVNKITEDDVFPAEKINNPFISQKK